MMSILDKLYAEHKKVMVMVRHLERAIAGLKQGKPVSSQTLQEVSSFLGRDYLLHLQTEDEAVLPLLAKVMGIELGPIPLKLWEHYYFRIKIPEFQEAVQRLEKGGEDAKDKLVTISQELTQALRAHSKEEYAILFPLAKQILSEEQLEEADRAREEIHSRSQ